MSTSIHWHGIILPYQMDGVPGISFAGIAPGETFTYRFKVGQSGTYWYHSHSAFQEITGMYGAIVVEPARGEIIRADRDHTVSYTHLDVYKRQGITSLRASSSASPVARSPSVSPTARAGSRATGRDWQWVSLVPAIPARR